MKNLLTEDELAFILEKVDSKMLPTPSLLIKDHKAPDKHGDYPHQLIRPVMNFTSGFPNVGYHGIKAIFKK